MITLPGGRTILQPCGHWWCSPLGWNMLRHKVLGKYVFVVLTLGVLFVARVLTATNPLASASAQSLPYDFSFGAAGGRHVVVGHNLYIQLQIALTTGTAQSLFFQVTGRPAGVSSSFPDLE